MTSDTSSAQPVPTANSDVDIIVHSAARPSTRPPGRGVSCLSLFVRAIIHTHALEPTISQRVFFFFSPFVTPSARYVVGKKKKFFKSSGRDVPFSSRRDPGARNFALIAAASETRGGDHRPFCRHRVLINPPNSSGRPRRLRPTRGLDRPR